MCVFKEELGKYHDLKGFQLRNRQTDSISILKRNRPFYFQILKRDMALYLFKIRHTYTQAITGEK